MIPLFLCFAGWLPNVYLWQNLSMNEKDYQEAIDWLFVQAPNYQINGKKAYKPGLENIRRLCDFFGNPQEKIKTIHIGGTNGKGSTSNMLASVLQQSGYKVGLFTSPHLIDFTERIKINGKNCDKDFVFDFIQKLKCLPEDIKPSFFEYTTIMAFDYFYKNQVDFAIIEVGLGGRLDSTNIILPMLSAITNISLDHQDILGETLEQIAQEKAGIIKPDIPIVCGSDDAIVKEIIRKIADENRSPFIDATERDSPFTTDLKGGYQQKNIRVVLSLIDVLKDLGIIITEEDIAAGLMNVQKNTGFIGRWYEFSRAPLTICDTGHNQAGLEEVFFQLCSMPVFKHIILGFVNDKKIDKVLSILPKNACYYFVKPSVERGRNPKEYEDLLKAQQISYHLFDSVNDGYTAALKSCKKDEMIFIGGSNFVVGDFLKENLEGK